ncbi:MAG TPA: MarR family transcriptional regulator [Dehalococcoidia bacterium]|nr:MarR family transcriptional regulator [Dehalococcoidia bacterium]
MPEATPRNRDYELWVLLDQVATLILNARDQELSQYGTTAMQAGVLFVTTQVGNETTPAEISRWILRKPSSVTGILDRMERAGLIKRTKDLPRRNLVRITLTDRGQKVYKQSLKRGTIRRIMSALSEEECEQLASLLEKLRAEAAKVAGVKHRIPFP